MYRVQPFFYFIFLPSDSPSFKRSWPEKMAGATTSTDPCHLFLCFSLSLCLSECILDAANDLRCHLFDAAVSFCRSVAGEI